MRKRGDPGLLEGYKTDRKATRYAKGVRQAIEGKTLNPGYVEALISAAYFNGHQSGELYQFGQAYPLLYGPRGGRRS